MPLNSKQTQLIDKLDFKTKKDRFELMMKYGFISAKERSRLEAEEQNK